MLLQIVNNKYLFHDIPLYSDIFFSTQSNLKSFSFPSFVVFHIPLISELQQIKISEKYMLLRPIRFQISSILTTKTYYSKLVMADMAD